MNRLSWNKPTPTIDVNQLTFDSQKAFGGEDVICNAYLNDTAVAFIGLEKRNYGGKRVMAVYKVIVNEELRGMGVGVALYRYARTACRDLMNLPMASDTQRNIASDTLWKTLGASFKSFEDLDTGEEETYYILY